MSWIKELFNKTKEIIPEPSPLDEHNRLLINRIIELLESAPQKFSAKWFSGRRLDSSIQSKDRAISIMIRTGQIISPTEPEMTTKQLNTIKQLVKPIVERDSKTLLDKLLESKIN